MSSEQTEIGEKQETFRYYKLTPDSNKSMKAFLEFDDLKNKLSNPEKENSIKVTIPEEQEKFAKQFLFQTNYYDFSIYKKHLPNLHNRDFTFQDCIELYEFNSFLRENLMKFTGKIELLIKSSIVHTLCSNYRGSLQAGECYLDKSIYKNEEYFKDIIERIGMSLYNLSSKSLPIQHHVKKKDCKFPFWVVVPELTFGETTKLIEQLNEKFYNLWIEELFFSNHYYETSMKDHVISASSSWISATCFIRNVCAHYGRLYASIFNASVPRFYTPTFRELRKCGKKKTHNKDLFAYMLAIKQILLCHNSNVHNEWNTFIEDIEEKFTKSSIIEETKIGCPKDWKRFLLIRLDK